MSQSAEKSSRSSKKRRRTLEDNEGWEARGNIEVEVKRRVRACGQDGVFGLLWEKQQKTGGEGEEDGVAFRRRVNPAAWGLVGWLLTLWKKDKDEYAAAYPDESE